jgi:hypothetical protein
VTVHSDATIVLPILATALAHSSADLAKNRKRPAFDPARREMLVDGAMISSDVFEEKGH